MDASGQTVGYIAEEEAGLASTIGTSDLQIISLSKFMPTLLCGVPRSPSPSHSQAFQMHCDGRFGQCHIQSQYSWASLCYGALADSDVLPR